MIRQSKYSIAPLSALDSTPGGYDDHPSLQSSTAKVEDPTPPVNELPPAWKSVNAPPVVARKSRFPFTKTFGLRHKSTVDWGMRDRARNKVSWDKYWHQFEAERRNKYRYGDGDEPDQNSASKPGDIPDLHKAPLNNVTLDKSAVVGPGADAGEEDIMDPEIDLEESPFWDETVSAFEEDGESGYFYHSQVLDHFYEPTTDSNPIASPPPPLNNTFRQYYHISSEFYKPAYELANATSGLLVALEHRFYGNSIPRLQDARASQNDSNIKQELINKIEGDDDIWGAASKAKSNPKANSTDKASKSKTKGGGKSNVGSGAGASSGSSNSTRKAKDKPKHTEDKSNSESSDGLPLDLLTYLNVDQSIEDIIYFVDQFAALQPTFFGNDSSDNTKASTVTRWILARCSYGGNLAAWTRQRYPSKIFAAFASSAPVHSVLDFYEYSTSQSSIIGKRCSRRMARARDFLDSALLMTDSFMQQMTQLDVAAKSKAKTGRSLATSETISGEEEGDVHLQDTVFLDQNSHGSERVENDSPTLATSASKNTSGVTSDDKKARQAAKLRVLTWFSSDFAQEYESEGEEVHAAGWIWWTVASAVQYNAVITPPTVQPPRTAVDILCDTMAQVDSTGMGAGSDDSDVQDESNDEVINGSSTPSTSTLSLLNLEYTQALGSWFKYQQYFTPTRTEDL
ncbi:hypothetical protein BGX26_006560 [Mortierella sp. AD094]|nr:hypothetical protein BGX26_006560 [Mortierella sp. AD094]